jgi:hypothetical protein
MEPQQIILVNSENSLVSENELAIITAAVGTLLKSVCSAWNRTHENIELLSWTVMKAAGQTPRADALSFFLIPDHQSIGDELKKYSEEPFRANGFICTKSILANSGVVIDPDGRRPSVAAALFKSIAEAIVNPNGSLWWQDPACGEFISAKICDPVESVPVVVTMTITPPPKDPEPAAVVESADPEMPPLEDAPVTINVALCNFVLPKWADAGAAEGSKFDFMGVLKTPFEVHPGGCTDKYEPISAPSQLHFGRKVPLWRRENRKVQYILDRVNARPGGSQ